MPYYIGMSCGEKQYAEPWLSVSRREARSTATYFQPHRNSCESSTSPTDILSIVSIVIGK